MGITDEMREAARTMEAAYSLDAAGDLVSRQYLAMRALDPEIVALRAELAARRPVVEAASGLMDRAFDLEPMGGEFDRLFAAVRAWRQGVHPSGR